MTAFGNGKYIMTHKQTIVKEARLQGKTTNECAALSGLSKAYVAHLIAGSKGHVKTAIAKVNSETERKLRIKTDISRETVLHSFMEIHRQAMALEPVMVKGKVVQYKQNLSAAVKALENIGRIIGAYGEDNKQKNTLGSALADMVKTRTALAASSVGLLEPGNDRHQQSTIEAEIVPPAGREAASSGSEDGSGRDEADGGAEGEMGGGCCI